MPHVNALRALFTAAFLLLAGSLTPFGAVRAEEAPKVVVSLLPIHSLAAQIMEGVGEPALLLDAGASPHSYQLRPSDASMIQKADLVIWVGEAMEGFLSRPLASLSAPGRQLELLSLKGLLLSEEEHRHAHGENEHAGSELEPGAEDDHPLGIDGHIWLAPENAAIILKGIAKRLATLDPSNESLYRENLEAALVRLEALDRTLGERLEGLDLPFVVFHDAYGGFVQHYGLEQAGIVTLSPDRAPGAGHLTELRHMIEERGVVCLFAEPQFSPAILESLRLDLEIKVGKLDPLGVGLEPGPAAYGQLLEGLANSLLSCFS